MYRLLALCARAECNELHYSRLARLAANLPSWDDVPARAEAEGMAPLLYTHLKAAGISPPLITQRALQGLYLRHRHINQVRTRVLRDVLAAFAAADIQTVVLKGGALSHVVYPEPSLRPMGDLDILVPGSDLWRAQSLLADLGFEAPLPSSATPSHRHLPVATLRTEGLAIQVEIHHKLFCDYRDHVRSRLSSRVPLLSRSTPSAPVLTSPLHPFPLLDLTAHTLGYEDSLWYLCRHLASHVNAWDSARLIWIADIVSFAERVVSAVDWQRVRRQHPIVSNTLSLLHFMTPLSDELLNVAAVKVGRPPRGMGIGYQGWPRVETKSWREKGYRRVLRDTFYPSEWWLRLRYKLGSARSLFWYRWIRHPLYLLGHVARVFLERLGWPASLELAELAPRPNVRSLHQREEV